MHYYFIKAKTAQRLYTLQAAIEAGIGVIYPDIARFTRSLEWVRCDGQAISCQEYPDLFLVLGNRFGGNGTTFNVPDMRGTGHR